MKKITLFSILLVSIINILIALATFFIYREQKQIDKKIDIIMEKSDMQMASSLDIIDMLSDTNN